jgi:hypothetical protein
MKNKKLLLIGTIAALAATATILLVRKNKAGSSGKPPKKAPQVPIQNPGEQSEFTTMASESELG